MVAAPPQCGSEAGAAALASRPKLEIARARYTGYESQKGMAVRPDSLADCQ